MFDLRLPHILASATLAVVGFGHVGASQPAHAADPAPGRYTMQPGGDGGFVRLDTQTGVMALCAKAGDGWECKPMPDEAKALSDQMAELQSENKTLKDEVRRMEDTFGLNGPKPGDAPLAGPNADPNAGPNSGPPAPLPPKLALPSEEDVDKALDYVERMIKKFRDRFEDLDKSTKPDKSPEATPL